MKCNVCGKDFELLKENKYLVRCTSVLCPSLRIYEAFDCPYCGCQNIVNERKDNIAVKRSRLSNCECNAIQEDWNDDEQSIEFEDLEELPREYDYEAMTKEELIKLCEERKLWIGPKSHVQRSYLVDKLVKFDKLQMEGRE